MIKNICKLVGAIILIAAVIVSIPLLGLWSLNMLFPALAIPYIWQTWVAFWLLFCMVPGLRFSRTSKS